jgi:hypothetical protein
MDGRARMGSFRIAVLTLSIVIVGQFASDLQAQTVRVDSGSQVGHGLMVRHQDTCFLVTARHVVEGNPIAAVRSAAPTEPGTATMQTPFWPGMDLAVGVLRGVIEGRCTLPLERLSGGLGAETVADPELVRLRDNGEVERAPIRIATTSYLTFDGVMVASEDTIYQGSSGAFAMSGDRPLGMLISTTDGRGGQFIRIEEIEPNLRRWITRRVGLTSRPVTAGVTAGAEDASAAAIPVTLVSAARPPIGSDFVPENLLGPGAYIFEPGINRIEFRVPGSEAVSLSRVVIETAADSGDALPSDITLEVSNRPDGGNWRPFHAGTMAQDGVLDLRRSAQLVRWIAITVRSAQSEGPVRIDRVQFE